MALVFITGSADGLGRAAAQSLLNSGHKVVLHGADSGIRNWDRSDFLWRRPFSENFEIGQSIGADNGCTNGG